MSHRGAEGDIRVSLYVDHHDVVRLAWKPGLEIDGDLATTAMRAVDDLNDGSRRPLCVDMTGTAGLTRDARQAFMRPCSASRVALLGRSAVDRVLVNFALSVSPIPVPTRFFTSESSALAWLQDDCAAA